MPERSEVRNAADEGQVKRAGRKERRREEQRRARIVAVMSLAEGRAMMWDLLTRAGIFTSSFHPSGSTVYYNMGRADFGREILADLVDIDGDLYLLMEQEARLRARREAAETDAAHTARAEDDTNERTQVDG